MQNTAAIAGLQEAIQQAESELSMLAEQLKEKRAEVHRCQKALCALTGQSIRRKRKQQEESGATVV